MSAELRLLIVDGDPTSLVELARGLSQLGWDVVCEAQLPRVRLLLREQPCVAILAELQWAALDGLALMQELRELVPSACLLATSERLDVGATVNAMRAGADDVLEKPLAVHLVDERLRQALERRRGPLAAPARDDAASIVLGETAGVRTVREQIRTVARFRDLPVMITGETGTGKELIAQAIHSLSENHGPFVPVNCSAIPETLFESELFGHEAGAFTGARAARAGLFETAGSGTLLLDELGEMPSLLQPKLLRAIEARTFRRIGGNRDLPFRARIVSATHRKIGGKDSLVRSDLYYRLAGFTITTPALRHRAEDIDLLARHFLQCFSEHYGTRLEISPRALEALHTYHWPGNVRELRAVVEQAAVLSRDGRVGVAEIAAGLNDRKECSDDPTEAGFSSGTLRKVVPGEPLRELERRTIKETWDSSGHNMSAAARALGLPRTTLRDRIRKYGWR